VAWRRKGGLYLFLALVLLVGGWAVASATGWLDLLQARVFPSLRHRAMLSAGDFPAGVTAPGDEVASIPLRPTVIGFVPGGNAAALLLATGGQGTEARPGLLKSAYAIDARAAPFLREEELRTALAEGGERGGVDLAAVTVDRLAAWAPALRDAAPRVEMLLGRSRGEDVLAAVGVSSLAGLQGKRLGAAPQSPGHYFALWLLMRAGLTPLDVRWVELPSSFDAGRALREGRADAVVGLAADVEAAARERGGKVLATTADAPHLVSTVLVARGEFAARYPDAVRRIVRGLLDANAAVLKDSGPAARLLGDVAPQLGDPSEAVRNSAPATLKDNLAFFGLAGEAPVTYEELYQSALQLFSKLERRTEPLRGAGETVDLSALRGMAEARGP
jgi:ABC-type nitrate/sulfonate/bicarbonate transport system substrate-binding protein